MDPELPGALKIIEKLAARGVVASFGHSDADYARTKDGITAGITHVTHLFNAMGSMGHRSPGPIPALVRYHDGTLVGTGVGLSELTGRFAEFSGWTMPQAIRAASVTPLSVLGLSPNSRPLIQAGNPADLVIAKIENQTLHIQATLVAGQVVYSGPRITG